MKKALSVLLAVLVAAVCVTVVGCKKDDRIKIGVVQLVEHAALDAAYQGFVDGLAEAGYVDGENIVIDYQNAQGEQANCVTIGNKLVNDNPALILAIATPAAQAVAQLTSTIPILVTAVTNPASSNLVKSNEHPETNVSGTSDMTPVAIQIELLRKIVPHARTVGLLYCSSEPNSVEQIALAREACAQNGFAFVEATVSNSNEIQQVTQSLVGRVDALYIPTDNMLAAGMSLVAQVANENKIPTMVGEDGMVQNGGMITYGINYYDLGKKTALQAVAILRDGKNPADMPIAYSESYTLSVNKESLEAVGIALPQL